MTRLLVLILARCAIALAFLVGCRKDKPVPTCQEVGAHVVAHIRATHPFPEADPMRKAAERLVPWNGTLTDTDRTYIEQACVTWIADVRRCVLDTRGERPRCGNDEDKAAWIMLPREKEWLDKVGELSSDIYGKAVARSTEADITVSRVEAELRAATTAADREKLEAQLIDARKALDAAQAFSTDCGAHPLIKPRCLELLDRK